MLHVEDRERDVALLARYLKRAGYELISERVAVWRNPPALVAACDHHSSGFAVRVHQALFKG